MKHPLKVSLEDLYAGKTAKLAINRDKIIGDAKMCTDCNGRGVIVRLRQIGPGMVQQIQQPCDTCGGTGYKVKKQKERTVLEVNIEKGMYNGDKIRFAGMSDEQPNVEAGDVIFVLQEKDHAMFKRKGSDLLLQKDVTLLEALTGYEFVIPHLDGRTIVVRSKPGEIVRPEAAQGEPFIKCVEGEGMPKKNTGGLEKGRLFIYYRIVFPTVRAPPHLLSSLCLPASPFRPLTPLPVLPGGFFERRRCRRTPHRPAGPGGQPRLRRERGGYLHHGAGGSARLRKEGRSGAGCL